MGNKQTTYIYTYRYMWQSKNTNDICVKVLSGVPEEHARFIKSINESADVVKCTRVYMSQCDVEKLEQYENIKTENKQEEVKV